MVVGQRLGCKGSDLSFVNFNGRGDKRGSIGKVLLDALNEFFHSLVSLWGKNQLLEQVVYLTHDPRSARLPPQVN